MEWDFEHLTNLNRLENVGLRVDFFKPGFFFYAFLLYQICNMMFIRLVLHIKFFFFCIDDDEKLQVLPYFFYSITTTKASSSIYVPCFAEIEFKQIFFGFLIETICKLLREVEERSFRHVSLRS